MKRFVDYLIESVNTYRFRIKIAGDLPEDAMERLEMSLDRHSLENISRPRSTPIQENPLGFSPSVNNVAVHIIDIETAYPTTPNELQVQVSDCLQVPATHVVVINPEHPEEIAQAQAAQVEDKEYQVLLTAPYPKADRQASIYGDEYNRRMLKDIKTRDYQFAAKRTPRAATLNDDKSGRTSPLGSKT